MPEAAVFGGGMHHCHAETDRELQLTPITETEDHVLTVCPGYHSIRSNLSENLKSLLMLREYGAIMNSHHVEEFGKYLVDSWRHRNPHKKIRW